ncbi:MAG: response regulator [Lachnospiraceae bacterium]|nr:response regulator [Lachnospiraceae bacterium]
MTQLRGVIIDDDRMRRDTVKSILPDYIECATVGSGDDALKYVKRDAQGNLPDFVILNGDDPKNFGLYVYDWMINKSMDADIAAIPVIVLTKDEFSDDCIEFLEIGDVIFYEGDADEDELFSVINEAIEKAEFAPPVVEPSFEETKSIDRLMGQSVKAPSGDGDQRAVVLDMNERVVNLEAALERGRKRVEQIRTVIDAAQRAKDEDDDLNIGRRRKVSKEEENVNRMSAFLQKARENANVEEDLKRKLYGDTAKKPAGPVDILKQKAMSNPAGAFSAQGTIRLEDRPKSHEAPPVENEEKKTVIIVDSELKTRRLCSLFLTQRYNVVAYDSGIKTVDHFIRHSADLLLINPALPGMNGIVTVSSIRMHPGGRNVPVMFLVGDDFTQSRSSLLGPLVVGILNKPIKQATLAQAVDGYFENLKKAQGTNTNRW